MLGHKMGGVFVDVGGYDGVTGSNSLFFELFRGWSGVLVEPAPTQLRKAEAVRRSPCLGYAVAGETGTLEFMEVTKGFMQMSGFLDSYEPDLLMWVRGDKRLEEVVHKLETKTLNDILSAQKITQVDFLSLDVEGGEIGILSKFDFDAVDVEVWSIKNNTQDTTIPEMMRDNGFDLIEFAGVDDIFRKRRAKQGA
ncbi:MAG: FkbM family methyltransferase [Amylibacter sp.]